MCHNINFSKLACEYLFECFNIYELSQKHQIPQSTVVSYLFKYLEVYPESKYSVLIYRKFKTEMVNNFLDYKGLRHDFVKPYGITVSKLICIVNDYLEDRKLVPSDHQANNLYLILNRYHILCNIQHIPPRIVNYIGCLYVNYVPDYTRIALIYGFNECTVARIMKRGIKENIFSDELAEKVYAKVLHSKYQSPETVRSYEFAFETRDANKQTA